MLENFKFFFQPLTSFLSTRVCATTNKFQNSKIPLRSPLPNTPKAPSLKINEKRPFAVGPWSCCSGNRGLASGIRANERSRIDYWCLFFMFTLLATASTSPQQLHQASSTKVSPRSSLVQPSTRSSNKYSSKLYCIRRQQGERSTNNHRVSTAATGLLVATSSPSISAQFSFPPDDAIRITTPNNKGWPQ